MSLGIAFAARTDAVEVPLGTWLEEDNPGISSVTGSGDSFTASPGPSGIEPISDPSNFDQRLSAWQRVYQTFAQPIDFSTGGQTIQITFDVEFHATPKNNDRDFRMSVIDTSTNQGFYGVSFDAGTRTGTYTQARFVDQIDGEVGDPWGGTFSDALNGSGTISSTSTGPTVSNGATALGLTRGNVVSFDLLLFRESNNSFSFASNATEADGDVVYPELLNNYDPVNPLNGDTSVSNTAINQIDGIVFGVFDDQPFTSDGDYNDDGTVDAADYTVWRDNFGAPAGTLPNDPNSGAIGSAQYLTWVENFGATESYTVSNLVIEASALVPAATAIPEPVSLACLAAGGLALLPVRRRS